MLYPAALAMAIAASISPANLSFSCSEISPLTLPMNAWTLLWLNITFLQGQGIVGIRGGLSALFVRAQYRVDVYGSLDVVRCLPRSMHWQ